MSEPAPANKARVIVELSPDGNLILEYYRNGQRARTELSSWEALSEIKSTLLSIQADLADAEKHKLARAEAKAKERHRNVFSTDAINHGFAHAVKFIKGERYVRGENARFGRWIEQEPVAKPKPEPKAMPNLADLL